LTAVTVSWARETAGQAAAAASIVSVVFMVYVRRRIGGVGACIQQNDAVTVHKLAHLSDAGTRWLSQLKDSSVSKLACDLLSSLRTSNACSESAHFKS
jgi:hypothetical protein